MPLYKYECPKCHEQQELLVKMSDWDKTQLCPHCETKMDKLMTRTHFKHAGGRLNRDESGGLDVRGVNE